MSSSPDYLTVWLSGAANLSVYLLPTITELTASAHRLEIQYHRFLSSFLLILDALSYLRCHLLNTA